MLYIHCCLAIGTKLLIKEGGTLNLSLQSASVYVRVYADNRSPTAVAFVVFHRFTSVDQFSLITFQFLESWTGKDHLSYFWKLHVVFG